MPLARHVALDIAGHAGAADLGPYRVNLAPHAGANLTRQRRTTLAVAAHARLPRVDELFRDQSERVIFLDAEARPVLRIGAAGAAALAQSFSIDGGFDFHSARLARKGGADQPAAWAPQGSLGC